MINKILSASCLWLLSIAAIAAPTVIVNVGDSITQGVVERGDYSKALNIELKYDNYVVLNCGRSGKTMSSLVAADYRKTPQYEIALKLPADIVTIMLGTNDSKMGSDQPGRNIWPTIKPTFGEEALQLVETFRVLPSQPEVWLCTPPPASDDNRFYIKGSVILNEQIPILMEVARKHAIPTIDIWHTELLKHIGDGTADATTSGTLPNDYFSDGVHPTRMANTIIGKKIASMLTRERPKIETTATQLRCAMTGADYQWYRDGKPVPESEGGREQMLKQSPAGTYRVGVRLDPAQFDTLISEPLVFEGR